MKLSFLTQSYLQVIIVWLFFSFRKSSFFSNLDHTNFQDWISPNIIETNDIMTINHCGAPAGLASDGSPGRGSWPFRVYWIPHNDPWACFRESNMFKQELPKKGKKRPNLKRLCDISKLGWDMDEYDQVEDSIHHIGGSIIIHSQSQLR